MKNAKRTASGDSDRFVSPYSKWSDPIWIFDNDVPGQRPRSSQIDWRQIRYSDGENLYDDGPASLLEQFKVFIDISLSSLAGEAAMAVGGLRGIQTAMGVLSNWLASEHIDSVADIDEEVSWTLVDWMESSYAEQKEGNAKNGQSRELTHAAAWRPVNLLIQLFERRAEMRRRGVGCISERPFGPDSTAFGIVTEAMALKREGRLHPIPDAIALPVLTQALRMILVAADDVLDLQDSVLRLIVDYQVDGYRLSNDRMVEAIQSFRFRACSDEAAPWRGPVEDLVSRTMIDGRTVQLTVIQQFRRMILSVLQACVVVLQGLTGMRASELCGLEAASLDESGSPECLKTRQTADGTFELFELHGRTVKGRRESTYWVVGARPVGSTYEPPTVRAVRILGRLLAPWRKLGGRTTLLCTFRAARGLPRTKGSIGRVFSTTITTWQKEFCFEYVDDSIIDASVLGGRPLYAHIRGHRWRTTFAIHLYRFDPRLVPAVSDHFKHLSQVMTEHGYIGTDPGLLDAMDSARVQSVAMMLLQLSSGSAPVAGPAARLVDQYRAELLQQLEGSEGVTPLARAERFVRVNALQIYNAQHGACLMAIMPMQSRCRQMSGTHAWYNVAPDTSVRTPAVCAGCQCYLVRTEHLSYWRRSVDEHRQVLGAARTDAERNELRVSAARLALAEAIVAKLERLERAGGQVSGIS